MTATSGRPGAGELFKLGLGVSFSFFLAALLIAWAGGAEFVEAFKVGVMWGGIILGVVWPALLAIYAGGGIGRMIDHVLLADLRRREVASQERIRMAEIGMQQAVSMANVRIIGEREETARAALVASNATPKALLLRSPAEQKLIDAMMTAYRHADLSTGYLPNDRANPIGKRALGAEYAEIVDWLRDPGRRHNVMGTEPVAIYDEERRSWRLNLAKYPTPDVALRALTGR